MQNYTQVSVINEEFRNYAYENEKLKEFSKKLSKTRNKYEFLTN